jgi:hypothetical protein
MPFMVFVVVFNFIFRIMPRFLRKREAKPVPLCVGCFRAHLQYGANAKRAISCTYGGAARPIKLDVLYCTDYQTRNPPLRPRVIGFVREIVTAD